MPFDTKENIQFFEDRKMEDYRFIDLDIKIGKVYLYRHNESCDHMLVFNDLRYNKFKKGFCKAF